MIARLALDTDRTGATTVITFQATDARYTLEEQLVPFCAQMAVAATTSGVWRSHNVRRTMGFNTAVTEASKQ